MAIDYNSQYVGPGWDRSVATADQNKSHDKLLESLSSDYFKGLNETRDEVNKNMTNYINGVYA